MPETDPGLLADLALLEAAARKAGEITLGFFGRDPQTWMKAGSSPVSEADMAADAYLRETLLAARPDYGWLSEETADTPDRLGKTRVFVVDPIDGTRAFLAGKDEWTISLAVVENGRPVVAVLLNPVRGELFTAVAGCGTRLNGRLVTARVREDLTGATLLGPQGLLNRAAEEGGIVPSGTIGSLAYRIAKVAAGDVDLAAARANAHDWDLAAADLLVQEAGGRLTDWSGAACLYNREALQHPELVAAGEALSPKASAFLRGLKLR
ncbi:3'(2'),5'-bisphosphate nucleotidase CysQ [Pannonibacter sp. Pt2]|uniref:3'(2'),5'-bisphosphate nucleotidase CysQ n=1 Tax=Pannonibacter anstelovis TaxID=3121537 RepID=A0ABU7ZJK3_9HYPH